MTAPEREPATLKGILENLVRHVNWREEQEIIDIFADINDVFPPPEEDNTEPAVAEDDKPAE